MTGPEHYREAERLISTTVEKDGLIGTPHPHVLALAQVHATLALAAATALGREGEGRTQPSMDRDAWFNAAAECRKQAQA